MNKLIVFLAALLLIGSLASSAQATGIVDNWTLNLDAIDDSTTEGAALSGMITNIDQLFYNGIAWSYTNDENGNGFADQGEYGVTNGLLNSMTYSSSASGTETVWNDGNTAFNLTFDFSVNSIGTESYISSEGDLITTWEHLAAEDTTAGSFSVDGILDIYLDLNVGTFYSDANYSTGDDFTDGILIAQFEIVAGDGGTFNTKLFDGHDDATFEMIWAIDDLFQLADGTDLTDLIGTIDAASIAITDSNFDGDKDDNGTLDSVYGTNVWTGVASPQTGINFIADENGSASLGTNVVPEPCTLLLFGIGLLSIAGIRRKRRG